jgi:methionyl aminopeptidase
LRPGDIINIDVTVILDGWHGDTSRTYKLATTTKQASRLVDTAEQALRVGITAVRPGAYFNDIGRAIQDYVERQGFSVVRDYCGHGIGLGFHEEPSIMHFDAGIPGEQIQPGMVFTIEPMVNAGTHKTRLQKDGWTATTADKSLSAQFEHTICVLGEQVKILTA